MTNVPFITYQIDETDEFSFKNTLMETLGRDALIVCQSPGNWHNRCGGNLVKSIKITDAYSLLSIKCRSEMCPIKILAAMWNDLHTVLFIAMLYIISKDRKSPKSFQLEIVKSYSHKGKLFSWRKELGALPILKKKKKSKMQTIYKTLNLRLKCKTHFIFELT